MQTQDFTVTGMTCQHCVTSVTEEVTGLAGVRDVVVDLAAGALQVTGDDVPADRIRAAVAEAGYTAVPA